MKWTIWTTSYRYNQQLYKYEVLRNSLNKKHKKVVETRRFSKKFKSENRQTNTHTHTRNVTTNPSVRTVHKTIFNYKL